MILYLFHPSVRRSRLAIAVMVRVLEDLTGRLACGSGVTIDLVESIRMHLLIFLI